eukprot:8400375-Pyramimonas_sp.AAC.2
MTRRGVSHYNANATSGYRSPRRRRFYSGPHLDGGVEEGKAEEQLLPGAQLGAVLVLLRGHVVKGAVDVRLDALRRLVGELDAVLQHQHREGGGGHGRKPQAEVLVRVRLLGGQALHDHLQPEHPAGGQVAVLQAHPVARLAPL